MNDEQISTYVRRVDSALHLPRRQRRRAVEEIRNHLDDGAAAHMRDGATRPQAVALAISELGEPDSVAAEFNDDGAHGSNLVGLRRWLPLILPMLLFVVAGGVLAWSVVWVADGWTVGERTVQRGYLLSAAAAGALSGGAYVAITRAARDSAWRWAAWACTGVALVIIVAG